MSWDLIVQQLPDGVWTVADIPDDFVPGSLGPRATILAAIQRVAPDADVSAPSWGRIERDGVHVEVNLGDADPVRSFALHVRGSGEATRLVRELLDALGMRALDPRSPTGIFALHPGIDDVDWTTLQHAYGVATDVPGQLRALRSLDPEARRAAFYALHGNIWHQGTVYTATAPALAFLVELLRDEQYPQRDDLACLIGAILAGRGYWQVHGSLIGTARPADLDARLSEEARILAAVRSVGYAAVPLLKPFLEHRDAEVRAIVFEGLTSYAATDAGVIEALRRTHARESSDEVRVRMADAMAPFDGGHR